MVSMVPETEGSMNLFQRGVFTLHSGQQSSFKIDCDALTDEDWDCLAAMLVEILPPFSDVAGIPSGGVKLAKALQPYVEDEPNRGILIVDDVVTTGESFLQAARWLVPPNRACFGAAIFARGECPEWVTPLFRMSEPYWNAKSPQDES